MREINLCQLDTVSLAGTTLDFLAPLGDLILIRRALYLLKKKLSPCFHRIASHHLLNQELAAVDAVMQFAIHKLGFLPENILVYGWSIGM